MGLSHFFFQLISYLDESIDVLCKLLVKKVDIENFLLMVVMIIETSVAN
jgi:hypothetical protein